MGSEEGIPLNPRRFLGDRTLHYSAFPSHMVSVGWSWKQRPAPMGRTPLFDDCILVYIGTRVPLADEILFAYYSNVPSVLSGPVTGKLGLAEATCTYGDKNASKSALPQLKRVGLCAGSPLLNLPIRQLL